MKKLILYFCNNSKPTIYLFLLFKAYFLSAQPCSSIRVSNQSKTFDSGYCIGGTASFFVSIEMDDYTKGPTYQFRKNGQPYGDPVHTGYTGWLYVRNITMADNNSVFDCVITDNNNGCQITSDTMVLHVIFPPSITRQPEDQFAEIGSSVTFSIEAQQVNLFNYPNLVWRKNGNPIQGAVGSTHTLHHITSDDYNDYYDCVVTSPVGCTYEGFPPVVSTSVKIKRAVSIEHYHQLTQNTAFQQRKLFALNQPFKICADGSEASIFKIRGGMHNYASINARIRENTNNTDLYGVFTITHRNQDSLLIRYKHPKYFNGTVKFITLTIEFYDENNPSNIIGINAVKVYRAPVVFVHGLMADLMTFQKMESYLLLAMYESQFINRVDYSSTNTASFSTNRNIVPNAINVLLNALRSSNISAGKVACIGHSMGGVLSRIYLQNSSTEPYRDDIQKLITINTPHSGSHLPCLLTDPTLPGDIINRLAIYERLGQVFWCNNCEALTNLGIESTATRVLLNGVNNLNKNLIPTHAIATRSPFVVNDYVVGKFYTLPIDNFLYAQLGKTPDAVFNEPNDWAVAYTSQLGGLSSNCTTTIENEIHMGSTNNANVITAVINLLQENPSGTRFCHSGFNPSTMSCSYYNSQYTVVEVPENANTSPLKISINSPERGAFAYNANYFGVKVSGTNISNITAYMSYTRDSIYVGKFEGNNASFSFLQPYTIPLQRDVVVIGRNANEVITVSAKNTFCESLAWGTWSNPSVWSCGRVPNENDVVILHQNHMLTISGNYKVKAVIYKGGKFEINQGSLEIKNN